jgi:hypothetical protein
MAIAFLSASAGKIMSSDGRHFKTKRQFPKKGSRELDDSPRLNKQACRGQKLNESFSRYFNRLK